MPSGESRRKANSCDEEQRGDADRSRSNVETTAAPGEPARRIGEAEQRSG